MQKDFFDSIDPEQTSAAQQGAACLAGPRAATFLVSENDFGVQRDAPVQVLDVVVDQANASGRNEVTDRLRRVGAVDFDWSAPNRAGASSGTKATFEGSSKMAAATARQKSTSKPDQLFLSSASEKPSKP